MSSTEEIARFFKQIGLTLGIAVVLLAYPVYARWGWDVLLTAAIGCGISTVNVLVGGASAVWAFDKPQAVFLQILLGGMGLRMLGVLVVFIGIVRLTDQSVLVLGASLFMFYLIYQILEIRFLDRRASGGHQGGE